MLIMFGAVTIWDIGIEWYFPRIYNLRGPKAFSLIYKCVEGLKDLFSIKSYRLAIGTKFLIGIF